MCKRNSDGKDRQGSRVRYRDGWNGEKLRQSEVLGKKRNNGRIVELRADEAIEVKSGANARTAHTARYNNQATVVVVAFACDPSPAQPRNPEDPKSKKI